MLGQAFGLALHVDAVDGPADLTDHVGRRLALVPGHGTEHVRLAVRPERARPGFWKVLDEAGSPLGHADDVAELASLIADLFHEALFDHCPLHDPARMVVHAGAVAIDGRGLLIPGTSGSGKSTLVDALVAAGASYLSDEYAILDEDGFVWPYARPIAMRTEGPDQRPQPAASRPPTTIDHPVPVEVIVDTRHSVGEVWQPNEITGAAVPLPLLAQSAGVRQHPRLALAVAAGLSETVLWRGPRGDAVDTAAQIIDRVSSTPGVTASHIAPRIETAS